MTSNSKTVHPASYPLGVVAVKYQENVAVGNNENTTQGIVSRLGSKFVLDVKGLPTHLANGYTEFAGTNSAVILDTPETGMLGFTKGCIERTINNAIPTSHVDLPTN